MHSLLAARAKQLGVSPEEVERQEFAPGQRHLPDGACIPDRIRHGIPGLRGAWAISGELVAATGGAGRIYY